MKKRFLLVVVLLCNMLWAHAQDLPENSAQEAQPATFSLANAGVQVHAGTQGFGLSAHYNFLPRLAARLGGSYGKVNINNGFSFDNLNTDNHIEAKLGNAHLYGEYSALNWFRIVAGGAYFFNAEGNITMTPSESITQNGFTLEPEEIGVLTTKVTYKTFAPYIGLGFGKGLSEKRFNINVDLGFYYMSAPTVTMTGTEYLADNSQNGPILTENMKNYRLLPVLQLNFNFKLSK
jgi:hypothetical protein